MKDFTKETVFRIGAFLVLAMFILSTGCIKYVPVVGGGGEGGTHLPGSGTAQASTISTETSQPSLGVSPSVTVTTPSPDSFEVDQVDPSPYITPDPYKIPYHKPSNWTLTVDPDSVLRIPQFTKNIVLISNATAFRLNVTKGPLYINLTFNPLFSSPDNTNAQGTNSFVYSDAEVVVIDGSSGVVVTKDGYGGIYSSDAQKTITVYQEGPFIITLSGDFIEVNMAISTGSAQIVPQDTSSDSDNDIFG